MCKKIKGFMIRGIVFLLALTLMIPTLAQEETEIVFFDEKGDELIEPKAVEEIVNIDDEEGLWEYRSPSLEVKVQKHNEDRVIWYMAEIKTTSSEEIFRCVQALNDEAKWPAKIARETGTVFAINSDFHDLRVENKSRTGIVIRNGEIVGENTFAHNKGDFPNLDTMAIFEDGRMEVYPSDAHTAQEYLDMGALDVLAFGPYLMKDGVLNEEGLAKYGKSRAPRTAIGMVAPGHYLAMMAEGRHDGSKGVSVAFLAEKLLEKGCVTGFNLDGGQTATMLFMGEQIITVGQTKGINASARRAKEILGIGFSPMVMNSNQEK